MTHRLPPDVAEGVAQALGAGERADPFSSVSRLGGGCIDPAARIITQSGATAFLKWASTPGASRFSVESRGLQALAASGGPRIPHVLGVADGTPQSRGWLLLEYVEPGAADPDTFRRLGRELAILHRPIDGATPGWDEEGWIGSLPQSNAANGLDWPEFWRRLRLEAQWEEARGSFGSADRREWERLMESVRSGLAEWESEGLSLLHGDLWSGNVIVDAHGRPVLVDPAAYRGHREVDLAMMELFGGFPGDTLESYREAAPLSPGYSAVRRDLYQLYPLLVHVNLFGAGYVSGVRTRVRRLLAELG